MVVVVAELVLIAAAKKRETVWPGELEVVGDFAQSGVVVW